MRRHGDSLVKLTVSFGRRTYRVLLMRTIAKTSRLKPIVAIETVGQRFDIMDSEDAGGGSTTSYRG